MKVTLDDSHRLNAASGMTRVLYCTGLHTYICDTKIHRTTS
jgi:hypothetical protein